MGIDVYGSLAEAPSRGCVLMDGALDAFVNVCAGSCAACMCRFDTKCLWVWWFCGYIFVGVGAELEVWL